MRWFSKRRFNWIDIVGFSTVSTLLDSKSYWLAAGVLVALVFASCWAERRWGS